MIEFFITCVPPTATHQNKKVVIVRGFSRLADKPELVAAKSMLDSLLLPHQPKEPIAGAVRLSLTFYWPFPKSTPKKILAEGIAVKKTAPDCSNVAKTLEDRLAALRFIENDANVCELHVRKFLSNQPGIAVRIEAAE